MSVRPPISGREYYDIQRSLCYPLVRSLPSILRPSSLFGPRKSDKHLRSSTRRSPLPLQSVSLALRCFMKHATYQHTILPIEMLENIIDLCPGDTRADYGTLVALALSGPTFLCRARRNLYHHVILSRLSHLHLFLKTIDQHRALGDLVQELTLYPGGCRYVPLALLPRAKVLTLDVDPRQNPAKYFFAPTPFRHLNLKGLPFAPLRRIVQASQALQSLSVSGMPLERGYAARVSRRAEQHWIPDTLTHMYIQVSHF